MSAALDLLQQQANEIDAALAAFAPIVQSVTERLNAVDPKDPTALEQIAAIQADYNAARLTYTGIVKPLFATMRQEIDALPADEKAAGNAIYEAVVTRNNAQTVLTTEYTTARDTKKAEAQAAAAAVNKEVEDSAAKAPIQTDQQNKAYTASGGAQDDKNVPAASGQNNNTLNTNPPVGGGAPVVATPTTQAGKSDTAAAKNSNTTAIKPGKRTRNPLGDFSSYTYQISLYMITPDAYDAFIESGRKDLNAIKNIAPGATPAVPTTTTSTFVQAPGERGRTGSPPAVTTPAPKTGGAYLIAQSGGINNKTSKRAPGFDTDFYIDDLKITQAIGTKEVGAATNVSEMSFTITEPYGFSLLTKLRKAQNELAATTNTKNFAMVQNPARQFFILGIRFLGYDKDGNIIDPSKLTSADGSPAAPGAGLFERYYDILISDMKFKITGNPVVYNITATCPVQAIGFGSKFSTVISDIPVTADTVLNALFAPAKNQPNSNSPTALDPAQRAQQQQSNSPNMTSLFAKLNYDQQQLVGKGVTIPREYAVVFLGPNDGEQIKKATLRSKADLDKRKIPTTTATKTSESNQKTASKETPNDSLRTIKIAQGTPIIQAVSEIIKQSSYLEDALNQIDNTSLSPDPTTGSYEKQENAPKELKWFTINAEVKNKGWDPDQGDYVYKITYIIQPYSTPIVVAASASVTTPYYGAHKRYEYWYTGKNTEVIGYTQNMDFAYHNVTVQGFGVDARAQGGSTDIPVVAGQPQEQPSQGRINTGMEAQNMYMTSLFSPRDFGTAKINIVGDPDFLMQPAPSSINSLYNQFYGTDGFTINPNGGQVFIEINFKEPLDYNNNTGTMDLNKSIYFYNYPDYVQKDIDSRGGGISYMVTKVVSSFKGGKFEQELECSLNTFQDPGPSKAAATQGRPTNGAGKPGESQMADTASRTGTGSAPTPNGTGTTSGTGFVASPPSTFMDPSQLGNAGLLGSVGSINNVMDPAQKLAAAQVTIPTKLGQVTNDDAGVTIPTVFGRG
jgi:hypothetical protein